MFFDFLTAKHFSFSSCFPPSTFTQFFLSKLDKNDNFTTRLSLVENL